MNAYGPKSSARFSDQNQIVAGLDEPSSKATEKPGETPGDAPAREVAAQRCTARPPPKFSTSQADPEGGFKPAALSPPRPFGSRVPPRPAMALARSAECARGARQTGDTDQPPLRRITSEPPPSECTRAYDQAQFSTLIRQTDVGTPSLPPLASQPPVKRLLSVPPTRTGGFASRRPLDTIPDGDDVTTAYVRREHRDLIDDVHTRNTVVEALPAVDELLNVVPAAEKVAMPAGHDLTEKVAMPAGHDLTERVAMPIGHDLTEKVAMPIGHDLTEKVAMPIGFAETQPLPIDVARMQATALPPVRRRWLLWCGLGLGLALAAFYGLLRFGQLGATPVANLASTVRGGLSSEREGVPAGAAKGPAATIQLEIAISPSHAKIYLDGREASNPLLIAYPKDAAKHELRCVAEGYETQTRWLTFDSDLSVILGLVPLAKASAAPSDAAPSPAAASAVLAESGTPAAAPQGPSMPRARAALPMRAAPAVPAAPVAHSTTASRAAGEANGEASPNAATGAVADTPSGAVAKPSEPTPETPTNTTSGAVAKPSEPPAP